MLGIYLFIKLIKKGSVLWSLPFFLLGFYSYHGMKVFFLFFIPFLLFLHKEYFTDKRKELFLFSLGFLLIIFSFLAVTKFQGVTRQSVFLWNDSATAEKQVMYERTKNIAPVSLRPVMNNKLLYYIRVARENYLHAFSADFLFLYGDSLGIYSLYDRGVMYLFESVFLILGVIYLVTRKNKQVAVFVIGSLLLSVLPSTFTQDRNYVIRSMMMVPFLALIVGVGTMGLYERISIHKILRLCYLPCILLLYVVFSVSFLYQYYFRYTVYGAEQWFYSHRQVLLFIDQQKRGFSRILIKAPNDDFLWQYGVLDKADPKEMQAIWTRKTRTVGKVTFLTDCLQSHGEKFNPAIDLTPDTLYVATGTCSTENQSGILFREVGEPLRTTWIAFIRNK